MVTWSFAATDADGALWWGMLLLCSLRPAHATVALQRQLALRDSHYTFPQAQLLPCLPVGSLGDLILECMLSQGITVKPVACVWPLSPFWLAVAL